MEQSRVVDLSPTPQVSCIHASSYWHAALGHASVGFLEGGH